MYNKYYNVIINMSNLNERITISDVKLSTDKINKLIDNTNNLLTCDKECRKRKNIDNLRRLWDEAIDIEKNAPDNVEDAERNYYVFVDGEYKYNQMLLKRYKKQINEIEKKTMKLHNESINELKTYNEYYKSQVNSFDKLKKYLKINKNDNNKLNLELDNLISSIQTNDRKSVYEEKNISYVKNIHKIIIILLLLTNIYFIIHSIFIYINKKDKKLIIRNTIIFTFISFLLLVDYKNIYLIDIYKSIINILKFIYYSISS